MKAKRRTFKRTAKWHKALTIKELIHLRDMDTCSLNKFQMAIEHQRRMEQEHGMIKGSACWECRSIEHKLREGGHIL